MITSRSSRVIVAALAVVAAIGTADAARAGLWDLLALMLVTDVLVALLAVRAFGARPELRVRHDLVTWLEYRAAITGEAAEVIADRAIAAHRQAQDPDRHAVGEISSR